LPETNVINCAMKREEKVNSSIQKKEKKFEGILFDSFEKNFKTPEFRKTEKFPQFIVDWQLL
jgi:hypothetical protein